MAPRPLLLRRPSDLEPPYSRYRHPTVVQRASQTAPWSHGLYLRIPRPRGEQQQSPRGEARRVRLRQQQRDDRRRGQQQGPPRPRRRSARGAASVLHTEAVQAPAEPGPAVHAAQREIRADTERRDRAVHAGRPAARRQGQPGQRFGQRRGILGHHGEHAEHEEELHHLGREQGQEARGGLYYKLRSVLSFFFPGESMCSYFFDFSVLVWRSIWL